MNSETFSLINSINNTNIDIEDVLNYIEKMKQEKIIQQHKENYSIWQSTDNRWCTYVHDDSKPNNRRLVAKKTLEKLYEYIVCFYRERDEQSKLVRKTLKSFYPAWFDYKAVHTDSSTYMKRIDDDWNKYYVGTDIINIPLIKLDKPTLDVWAHSLIKQYSLTKKQYYNLTVIMRQSLEYAVELGIIVDNPLKRVKIQKNLFRPERKPDNHTQVFLTDEEPLIISEAWKDFNATGNLACLGIILAFQLGARVGEIVGLKWTDINEEKNNHIHIQRMEVKEYERIDGKKWKTLPPTIVEHTKTSESDRNVYLTKEARSILETIKQRNHDNEYIFVCNGERIHTRALDTRLRKYCRYCNIPIKSMHKIRKTYISKLIDNDLNIDYIRSQTGHADERTTYKSYCFNRRPDDDTNDLMEAALQLPS